ncbi:trans-sialidase, putative, partial [Trypanosoma cruzi]
MLSRVAAVKAPRTHNRRRVTGSSGRRREGGDSEPKRPNMSRHHFYFCGAATPPRDVLRHLWSCGRIDGGELSDCAAA